MSTLNLNNFIDDKDETKDKRKEVIKAEIGALLFNLGKTHIGFKFWRDYFSKYSHEFRFSSYKEYIKNGVFIDELRNIDNELADFFLNLNISLGFENIPIIELMLGGESNLDFVKDVFFRSCENINSGIDKGDPLKQLNLLWISNAFGSFKEEVIKENFDNRRLKFFKDFWDKVSSFGVEPDNLTYQNWIEIRNFVLEEIKKWYSHLLSDSRFPINDITLWDQAYMTASLFKATITAMLLDSSKVNEYKTPKKIKWSILGIQYDKLSLIEKSLKANYISWYNSKINECDKKIKSMIEEKYVLGNEIYRDETGIYFLVPENIICKDEENGLYRIHDDLKIIENDILDEFHNIFNHEIYPSIFLTKPSRGTMNLSYLVESAKENFLKPCLPENFGDEIVNNIVDDYNGLCYICGIRPGKKKEDLILCDICEEKRKLRMKEWYHNLNGETIWTGDIGDKNGRIALISLKFEMKEWLNGDFLNTFVNTDFDYKLSLKEIKDGLIKDKNKKIPNTLVGTTLRSVKITDFAETALLERSIGDRWENLITKKVGSKIDFENRKIHWDKLSNDEIDFLAEIILQFIVRKNPSPARLRRITETTKEFLEIMKKDLPSFMFDEEKRRWRNKRIIWYCGDNIKKNYEYEYKGLEFMSDSEGYVYLISSLDFAIDIIKNRTKIEKRFIKK
ncbi:CRISPR-associated protein Csx11 [Thermoanaerobacter siderophilus]|nr:CRISPR-associated protein Csx11 [Thermoanaerobacter siderophilus]